VRGTAITRQGRRIPDWLKVEQRKDGRGFPYYWIGFQRSKMDPEEGTDLFAIGNNEISVTPLSLDYTHDASLARLSEAFR
jgi:5'-nucleotidase